MVASNGAVVFRYPPMEVVHEETFDAAPAVAAVLEHHPRALVAVEEREVGGYRVNRVFPEGELSGEQLITHVDDIVGEPVSRVIVRDPEATADDFVELAANLGLHGTDYVVGWTAWLDLSPVGVSKASGLQHVCDELGLAAADVLAIGDGRNDIEMLRWAGRGVAMGQAVEEVIAAADDVTAHRQRRGRRRRDLALVPAGLLTVDEGVTFTAELWRWTARKESTDAGPVLLRDPAASTSPTRSASARASRGASARCGCAPVWAPPPGTPACSPTPPPGASCCRSRRRSARPPAWPRATC